MECGGQVQGPGELLLCELEEVGVDIVFVGFGDLEQKISKRFKVQPVASDEQRESVLQVRVEEGWFDPLVEW